MKPPPEKANLSPVQQLLVAAARPKLNSDQVAKLRLCCGESIDWNLAFDLAAWHGLTPLVARHLAEHCFDRIQNEVALEWSARSKAAASRALFASAHLGKILEQLKSAGIEAIPFKGPAQAAQLYGDVTLREFYDLDLLLRPEHASSADAAMAKAGYRAEVKVSPDQLALYMRSECDRVYVHPDTGVHVEVHWGLAPPCFGVGLFAHELIERAEPIELCGVSARTLSPEDLLLVLCLNGVKEMWEKLEWLCAVGSLLERNLALDWPSTYSRARQTGVYRMLLIGLALATEVLGCEIPGEAQLAIGGDRVVRKLVQRSKAWLFAPHFHSLSPWQITKFRLRARERMRDQWRYCWMRLLTPTHRDLTFVRLAPRLHRLYPLLRPVRLILRPGNRSRS